MKVVSLSAGCSLPGMELFGALHPLTSRSLPSANGILYSLSVNISLIRYESKSDKDVETRIEVGAWKETIREGTVYSRSVSLSTTKS